MSPDPKAVEIITRKKMQYCRFADSNQWDKFDNIMMPDIKCEFFNAEGNIHVENGIEHRWLSREGFVAYFKQANEQIQAVHLVSPADFEQVSADEVRAIWNLIYHAGSKGDQGGYHGTGGGQYYEVWKRVGEDWFMQSLRMERLYWKLQIL